MKIEPLTIEDIKELVSSRDHLRLILSWAHERAMSRKADHAWYAGSMPNHGKSGKSRENQCIVCNQPDDGWLNAVLDEINWPKDQR